jgi:proteasome accessory factor B
LHSPADSRTSSSRLSERGRILVAVPPTRRKRSAARPGPADAKLQRWIDLIAALLSHHYGVAFEVLRECVPGYRAARSQAALERMFERDKEELRALGFPIEQDSNGDEHRYFLRSKNLYLPRLGVGKLPTPPTRPNYRSVGTFSFEPDEIAILFRAALAVQAIGQPDLAADAASALQKLTHDIDLPLEELQKDPLLPVSEPATAAVMRPLGSALLRRKRVRFTYHSFSSGTVRKREVEPYGLFFLQGHWYLAGRDTRSGAVRNFRLSRITAVEVLRGSRADYQVPPDFDLRQHARSRESWELGDDLAQAVLVKFNLRSGAARAAALAGEPVPEKGVTVRRFEVRRLDPFVRWLLGLAGDAVPLAPQSVVRAYRGAVERALRIYGAVPARGRR